MAKCGIYLLFILCPHMVTMVGRGILHNCFASCVSFRHCDYDVAMAHRVVAQWFVRCRLHYRPTVASFICKVSRNIQ